MQCVVLAGGLGRRMLPQHWKSAQMPLRRSRQAFRRLATGLAGCARRRAGHHEHRLPRRPRSPAISATEVGSDCECVTSTKAMCRLGRVALCDWQSTKESPSQKFFVLYGDSYLTASLGEIETAYTIGRAPVLMTVYRDRDGLEHPNAVFDGTMVTRYEKGVEDPPEEMRLRRLRALGVGATGRRVDGARRAPSMDLADLFRVLSESGSTGGIEMARAILRNRFSSRAEGS